MATTTFSYTGADQTFTVPAAIHTITVDCQGAQGGPNSGATAGGLGGRVVCDIAVTPGETLHITVGQQGSLNGAAGFGGGGASTTSGGLAGSGGGGSDVRQGGTGLANRIVAAGGGGGTGGNGGGVGGSGGGGNGTAGANSSPVNGGGGGTTSTFGSGGSGTTGNGSNGASGLGGAGSTGNIRSGGGGGGGNWGGGGGGSGGTGQAGGGGGGGSGLTTGVNSTLTSGFRSGDGQVIFTYADHAAEDSAPATDVATRGIHGSGMASDSAPATDMASTIRIRTATDSAPAVDAAFSGALIPINPGFIGRTAVAYAPIIRDPTVIVPNLTAFIVPYDDPGAAGTEATLSFGRKWQDPLTDVGSGEISFSNTDTALATVDGDHLIRFHVKGVAAWTMLVEDLKRATIAQGDEFNQNTVVTGRGHIARLESALIYPARGVGQLPIEDDRVFNWTAPTPTFDDSSWGPSTVFCSVDAATAGAWPLQPFGDGIPFPDGISIIGPSSGTTTSAPIGFCYFRKDFTAPQHGRYVFYGAGDNTLNLYVDGVLLLTATDFRKAAFQGIDLTAGTHTIAAVVENQPQPVPPNPTPTTDNPIGLAVAVWTANLSNNPVAFVTSTDSTWKISAYPAVPPGMTPGQAIIVALTEAQARGVLTGVTPTFSITADSNGVPWPVVTDIATKVGTDMLTFLKEQGATYFDWWMPPASLDLNLWSIGTRGVNTGIGYVPNRRIFDGHSVATTTSITSATAAFTQADVGHRVVGHGIPPYATIASVTDATHAHLSVAATATQTDGQWVIRGTVTSLTHETQP